MASADGRSGRQEAGGRRREAGSIFHLSLDMIGHLIFVIEGRKETYKLHKFTGWEGGRAICKVPKIERAPPHFDISNSLLTVKPPISSLH